ncbi:MAG: hypothetical protein A2X25_13120 [Chloroflexi bacterium GWB2_49_20]|nr:MAG: hypothetical protein A2X25_13120 [Chloroflexi bacterium GWB2_49_20]OGN78346.1 MAG: hypothetical protein A2X26_01080 [Chloroflexi bacterium GWC2_49_37]OGN84190.1 MAG: hypothetical protein A2X27_14610 [Chloroflexi bacterium GWD2_49_16]HBG75150.1 hypothetical protein [Anaerolineae bacterium]HCC79214.1 hypothetical protein [Anaerolineae bacterium]
MTHYRKSIEIGAPPDKVFKVLDDPEHFPEWVDHCVEVKFLTPKKHGLDSAIELTLRFAGFDFKSRTKVIGYEKGYRFTIEGTQGIVGSRNTDTVEALPNGGSQVIWDVKYELPSIAGKIADELLLGRMFEQSVEKSLKNLKQKMEHGAAT